MNTFPTYLKPESVNKFNEIFINNQLSLLRIDIVDTLLSRKTENEYVDLTSYIRRGLTTCNFEPIIIELNTLGWKCSFSFNNTALFIYINDIPPNCFTETIDINKTSLF